ncbi:MAG: HAMP domain-containing protein [Chloroflexota bacterium]|nr:HAMP domain-containing protein [Chloroflexota bacterium]
MTQRVLAGVSLGIALILVVFALLALASMTQLSDAAGQEQVTVAQTLAMGSAKLLDDRGPSGADARTSASSLLPPVPSKLRVQLITASGEVLADSQSAPASMLADHVRLLRPLMTAGQSGFRIHRPAPKEAFGPHIVAYAPVPGFDRMGVIVQQEQPGVLDTVNLLVDRFLVVGAVLLALGIAVAWFDVHRVIGPLRALAGAAESFAAGQLNQPVPTERSDEVGSLARSFDRMRSQLQASMDRTERWSHELENRVAERTIELERRNRQLASIISVAEPLAGCLDESALLQRTIDNIIEVSDFEVALYRPVNPGHPLQSTVQLGAPKALQAEVVHEGECLCGRAARSGVSQWANSLGGELRAEPCRMAGMLSAIAVPLVSSERVEGVLFLGSKQAIQFESGDLDTFAAIGHQVGMALGNARLYQDLRERERERAELLQKVINGQEDERRRLAQELHDDTSQALAWLQLGLERLAAKQHEAETRKMAEQLQDVASQTLDAVHRLALELRPSVLDDIGLVPAIDRYVQDFSRHWKLPADFTAVGIEQLRLDPADETAVYRIVQAALTNAAQHAAARRVSVLLQRRTNQLVAVVEDDGRGFDLAAVRGSRLEARLGLAGMEERASLVGASLTFETAPGAGTTVFLEVPIHRNGGSQPA